jgi:hypothetical protein
MHRKCIAACLGVILVACATEAVRAVAVTVTDGDFELSSPPAIGNGQAQSQVYNPPDWTGTHGGVYGVLNPTGSDCTNFNSGFYSGLNLSANGNFEGYTQGVGTTFTNTNTVDTSTGLAGTYLAGYTYTMTALLGNAYENATGTATFNLVGVSGGTTTILATVTYTNPTRPATLNASVSFDTLTNLAAVGQTIGVQFVSGASGTEAIDNFAIDEEPDVATPEPTSVAIIGVGGFGLLTRRRRKLRI